MKDIEEIMKDKADRYGLTLDMLTKTELEQLRKEVSYTEIGCH